MNVYRVAEKAVAESRVDPECLECAGRGWKDLTPSLPAWESLAALCSCLISREDDVRTLLKGLSEKDSDSLVFLQRSLRRERRRLVGLLDSGDLTPEAFAHAMNEEVCRSIALTKETFDLEMDLGGVTLIDPKKMEKAEEENRGKTNP